MHIGISFYYILKMTANDMLKKKLTLIHIIVLCIFFSITLYNKVIAATINVKTLGAKGDGITDDTQAIKNAFSKAAVNGGTVYFPSGKYLTNIIDIRPSKAVTINITGVAGKTTLIKKVDDPVNVALFFCEVPNVSLSFTNLTLDGLKTRKFRKWKQVKAGVVDLDEAINGIYTYNINQLAVNNCVINNFHGQGIACYSGNKLIASKNQINNVSGSAITGHRVKSVYVSNCSIKNTGYIDETYILDGLKKNKKSSYPQTTFGDGIEGECDSMVAKNNYIVNPGRCGIVHDLARDLGYKNSVAIVSGNTIIVNSKNVNNNNPPSGMWFEQSYTVNVNKNVINLLNSESPVVSGLRFYAVTGSINCSDNIINADKYQNISNEAIGIFEPVLKAASITNNKMNGKFKNGITISYGNAESSILNLKIANNTIGALQHAIAFSIDAKKAFPQKVEISHNDIGLEISKTFLFSRYGAQPKDMPQSAVFHIRSNKIRGVINNQLPKTVAGIKFVN